MDISNVVYSTKPITLKDRILSKQMNENNPEALFELIVSRTNLTAGEALELDDEELVKVLDELSKAMLQAMQLQNLGKNLQC